MSNNLVSQPLSIPSTQMGPLEPIPSRADSQMPEMQMRFSAFVPEGSASQHSVFRQQEGFPGILPPLEKNTLNANGKEKIFMPQNSSKPLEGVGGTFSNQGMQQLSMENKRKAPMGLISSSSSPRSSMLPNKRAAQMEPRPWLMQPSAANRKSVPGQYMQTLGAKHLLAPSKKLAPAESVSPKSLLQRPSVPKNQMVNMQSSPKVRSESFESVRSKMRESLAAALALQNQEEVRSPRGKDPDSKASLASGLRQDIEPTPTSCDATNNVSEEQVDRITHSDGSVSQNSVNCSILSQEAFAEGRNSVSNMPSVSSGQDVQSGTVLLPEDLPFGDNFFVKDELLQGNGLSWVLETDMHIGERRDILASEMREKVHEEGRRQSVEPDSKSPDVLALRMEAELFKLFGGVNKKYKEKGRSLLFNLKDRNNPELRERVVSGEISPERLCSMSAEELASKELSQWRMAKAEELAQMVVLPDADVDLKRLVKKTHKGEFQVEVEQDDNASVEVSVGLTSGIQNRPKTDENGSSPSKPGEVQENLKAGSGKSGSANLDVTYTLTIPSEDHASEVDIMEDDATKDLPPIVSLDEFMESLDSEPPFEDLRVDDKKTESASKDPEVKSPEKTLNDSSKIEGRPEKTNETLSDVNLKSSDNNGNSDSKVLKLASKGELIWEGSLQLNITTTVSAYSILKSGEKAPSKDWSSFLEIKGRVRLDAFEKFLQDLRMSRSRAIMVVHFVCKEGLPESERASVFEVADSYFIDERVGFAEPSQGVELYICPPHVKTREMLGKILSEEHFNALNDVENGLIGVVVWRRSDVTSAIPSHSTKYSAKKQHYSSRRHKEKDVNVNYYTHGRAVPSNAHHISAQPQPGIDRPHHDGDDDDVPPGFGPGVARAARDDDDLPEFSFSGGSSSQGQHVVQDQTRGVGTGPLFGHSEPPSRPVEHIRQLIHKYGQTGTVALPGNYGVPVQPWDDDDDIPEWNPQGLYNSQQPLMPRNRPDARIASAQQLQNPNMHVSREALGRGVRSAAWSSRPLQGGQVHVASQVRPPGWRQETPRSRGF